MEREQVIPSQSRLLQLYFIRHGETEWSLSGQHTGRTDIPLTARGEDEARELGPCLREIQFARVLTSPRQRARRTCELAGLGPAAEIDPDLAEWDYGDYEGQRSVDIRKGRPDWNVFRDGCPRGEMPAQVSDRADRLIAHLRALDGTVALFSHGQFGCVLAARWIGLPAIEGQHFALGVASLSILGHEPSHPKVRVIALWNARHHCRVAHPPADCLITDLGAPTEPTLPNTGGLTLHKAEPGREVPARAISSNVGHAGDDGAFH